MNRPWIALTVGLYLTGAASAQVAPGDPVAGPQPTYAVEAVVLGSGVKLKSSMYREYKCGPSEQFDGFTWCQKSRRDKERRGSFEASYSILHAKDGTVVYANRSQQPAFFDGNETERDIQSYARKIGESPRITKMPRRLGTLDAVMAMWGKIELEPLDDDSIKLLAEGKSPRKGFLIDFISNFARSAQEGLPIYRISGGAGFVWVGSFDQKGRGTLRFAAIDASALPPVPVATPPASVAQPASAASRPAAMPPPVETQPAPVPSLAPVVIQPAPVPPLAAVPPQSAAVSPPAPAATQPAPVPPPAPAATQPAPVPTLAPVPTQSATVPPPAPAPAPRASAPQHEEQRPSPSGIELAAAVKAKEAAEAAVAQLRAELAGALREKTEAETARAEAQKLAREARRAAEIARKEFETAASDANAARDEIERLKADGGASPSYVKQAILIGMVTALVLFLVISVLSTMLGASPKQAAAQASADDDLEAPREEVDGTLVPLSTAAVVPAETESTIDQDDLVKQLAKTLGVEDLTPPLTAPAPPLTADVPVDADGEELRMERPEETAASTPAREAPLPSARLPDAEKRSSSEHDRAEVAPSSVPAAATSEADAAKLA